MCRRSEQLTSKTCKQTLIKILSLQNMFFNIQSILILCSVGFGNSLSDLEFDNTNHTTLDSKLSFEDTQLWRVNYTLNNLSSNVSEELVNTLENNFEGNIWQHNSQYLDIAINKDQIEAASDFLTQRNISKEILMHNVQSVIDENSQASPFMQKRTKRATKSGLDWQDYYDLDVIYAFMREIRAKFPDIVRLYSIGKTAEGRDLKLLRISENPREYKKIWIDGGIHAREWISPATVTYILYHIMSNWYDQPAYIRERTWYIMPVMNPDGYAYSRTTNRMWRKNRSKSKRANCFGVDLNRNFDISWSGHGSSTNPCSDTYRGTSPASELETKAVASFLEKRKYNLEAYLTYHSYGQMVVYPWAYKAVKVRDAAELQRVADTAVERIEIETGSKYRASVTHEVLGIAGGGSDDWARAALGTKYVYTVELRDRGFYGFILPPNEILETAKEGLIILETVAQAIK